MPRPARPPSNFTSDRHVLYAGWVLSEMSRSGLPATPIRDVDGDITNRIVLTAPLGGDNPAKIVLMIPPPPDDWDPFAGPTVTGPTFRGEEPEGAV